MKPYSHLINDPPKGLARLTLSKSRNCRACSVYVAVAFSNAAACSSSLSISTSSGCLFSVAVRVLEHQASDVLIDRTLTFTLVDFSLLADMDLTSVLRICLECPYQGVAEVDCGIEIATIPRSWPC